ncbi:nitroreductase [Mycobacterium sp. 1100029.7]|nr:nitroreductase [Mycobacterium sp. 1100029.7]
MTQTAFSTTDWVREHTQRILEQGTTEGIGESDERTKNRPIVLFTVIGAKSGLKRYVPLMRVEKNGHYAMIGSTGGAPKDPAWVGNLRANPKVSVQDGERVFDGTAREVFGAEREEWWQRGVDAYPHYTNLQSLTERQIPVFVVE